jgi:hypothetical protein
MSFDVPELASELKVLSGGRGMENAGLESRIGPTLRWTAGVQEDDGLVLIQHMADNCRRALAGFLPANAQRPTSAALGFGNEVGMSFIRSAGDRRDANSTAMSTPCSAGVDDGITWIAGLVLTCPNRQATKDIRCTIPEEFDRRSLLFLPAPRFFLPAVPAQEVNQGATFPGP